MKGGKEGEVCRDFEIFLLFLLIGMYVLHICESV